MFPSEKKNQDTEIVSKKEQEKQLKFVGRIRPHKGHTLYKVDKETLEITEAEFEKQDISLEQIQQGVKIPKKVIIEEGVVYISALNKKNVIKKFPRFGLKAK